MNRVVISRPIVGICHMQVCAAKDATDQEILEVANSLNPSGTEHGWSEVVRSGELAPVQCQTDPARLHFMISC